MASVLFDRYKIYEKDEIVQGTKEWHDLRCLKFTASNAETIQANGKGLETLVKEMLARHYSSQQYDEYTQAYKSPDMQRGNDFEAQARSVYELETGNSVKEVGFIERSDFIGCSPDGLVTLEGKDKYTGLIEIKNHSDKVFLELILSEKIDKKYIQQMQYQLWTSELDFCDYFGYNPNFEPSFYMERILPDAQMFEKFEIGVSTGVELLKNSQDILKDRLKVLETVVKTIEE